MRFNNVINFLKVTFLFKNKDKLKTTVDGIK